MKTLRKLINIWSDITVEEPYIAKEDKKVIDPSFITVKRTEDVTAFRFDFLPQPWWGNIINPKVIVLALNPGIDKTEKEDEKKYRDEILLNLSGQDTINWMSEGSSSGHKWWKDTFKEIIQKGSIDQNIIYKKVGIFELIGYHSKKFDSGNYETLEKMLEAKLGVKTGLLPTQNAMFNHLSYLIKKYKPVVVIIWGQKYWRKYVDGLDGYDYVDTVNTASHNLSIGNMRKIDFDTIVNALK